MVRSCVGPGEDQEDAQTERWPSAVIELEAQEQRFVYQLIDGEVDQSDAIANLTFQFLGEFQPTCHDACDFDDSGVLDITDPVNLLMHVFLDGAPPKAPGLTGLQRKPTRAT